MNKKSGVNFRFLLAAIFAGIFFAGASQARNLKGAPELPSIEVNFGAIEKLRAETRQLERQAKAEAEKIARVAADEMKKQLAEKKRAQEKSRLAKLDKKSRIAKNSEKKEKSKLASKSEKIEKKEVASVADAEVKKVEDVTEKTTEAPKQTSGISILTLKKDAEARKEDAQKAETPLKLTPVAKIDSVAKVEQPVVKTPQLAKVEPVLKIAPVPMVEPKQEIAIDLPGSKNTKDVEAAPVKSELPDLQLAGAKKNNPPASENVDVAPLAKNDVPVEGSSLLGKKVTGLFAAKDENATPADAEEDEEEIAANEYSKNDKAGDGDILAPLENAKIVPDQKEKFSGEVILPKAISASDDLDENIPAEKKQEVAKNSPPIPPLADVVEVKQAEQPKVIQSFKKIDEKHWNSVLEDAKKKAAAPADSKVAAVDTKPVEAAPAVKTDAPREVIPGKPLADIEPKAEKTSVISSLLDWMPSFGGNKAENSEPKLAQLPPAQLPAKSIDLEDLSAKNAKENGADKIVDTAQAGADKKPIVQKMKEPVLELAALPQVEKIALPAQLKPKSAGTLNISYDGSDMELSAADKASLADFVKGIISSQNKVKIISSSPTVANDANSARRISLKRAIAVRSQMIEYGLDSARISVQAVGSQENNANGVNIMVLDNPS